MSKTSQEQMHKKLSQKLHKIHMLTIRMHYYDLGHPLLTTDVHLKLERWGEKAHVCENFNIIIIIYLLLVILPFSSQLFSYSVTV